MQMRSALQGSWQALRPSLPFCLLVVTEDIRRGQLAFWLPGPFADSFFLPGFFPSRPSTRLYFRVFFSSPDFSFVYLAGFGFRHGTAHSKPGLGSQKSEPTPPCSLCETACIAVYQYTVKYVLAITKLCPAIKKILKKNTYIVIFLICRQILTYDNIAIQYVL